MESNVYIIHILMHIILKKNKSKQSLIIKQFICFKCIHMGCTLHWFTGPSNRVQYVSYPHYERLYYFINLIVGTALDVGSTNTIRYMTLGNLCHVSIQVIIELDRAVFQPGKRDWTQCSDLSSRSTTTTITTPLCNSLPAKRTNLTTTASCWPKFSCVEIRCHKIVE